MYDYFWSTFSKRSSSENKRIIDFPVSAFGSCISEIVFGRKTSYNIDMNQAAKKILESYIFEKKRPTIQDLGLSDDPMAKNKYANFVTLYLNGVIVASSGRVHPSKDSTLEELIDNVIIAMDDPRFSQSIKNAEMSRKLAYRIDVIVPEYRRLLSSPDELDVSNEGIIVLCQKQGKLGVILPGMLDVKSSDEMYRHALTKAGIDTKILKKGDMQMYGFRTKVFQDA